MKLWGGRFTKVTNQTVTEFTSSIDFDHVLATYDIQGSLAHIKMLAQSHIIDSHEADQISQGLQRLLEKLEKGELEFSVDDEDIHMNIERLLHQEIGPVAGKLHTGRSRNDQVALDLHLYCRHHVLMILSKLVTLNQVLLEKAQLHTDTILPGYTHLQRAEPLRFAHHLMAYFNMFNRDIERLLDSLKRINISPLGAGALAGSGFPVDREYVAECLKFDGIYENSLDAVSDRDFVVELLSIASLIMMHFSKLSEEIILWCSQEFSFIQLDDAFCTGSSMMPQKKNPDVAELTRGKTGRVYGSLIAILTVLKGLPLAYNKDLQEDKESLFDAVKTVEQTLDVFTPMIATMTINTEVMYQAATRDYSNATQLANYLVSKSIPFRKAHEITGQIVLHCIDQNILLTALPLSSYQKFSPLIEDDIYPLLDVCHVIESHQATGGTGKMAVLAQFEKAKSQIQEIQNCLEQWNSSLYPATGN